MATPYRKLNWNLKDNLFVYPSIHHCFSLYFCEFQLIWILRAFIQIQNASKYNSVSCILLQFKSISNSGTKLELKSILNSILNGAQLPFNFHILKFNVQKTYPQMFWSCGDSNFDSRILNKHWLLSQYLSASHSLIFFYLSVSLLLTSWIFSAFHSNKTIINFKERPSFNQLSWKGHCLSENKQKYHKNHSADTIGTAR